MSTLELQTALLSTGQVQPVDMKSKGGKLEVLCRLVPGQEMAWVATMDRLLAAAEANGLELHLCRRYVRRGGAMVFGYHLGIERPSAKLLKDAIKDVVTVLSDVKPDLTPATAPQAPARAPATPPSPTAEVPARPAGGIGERPQNYTPTVKVVKREVGEDGREVIEEEMPLPHVHRELNKPKPKPGQNARDARGARTISSNAR